MEMSNVLMKGGGVVKYRILKRQGEAVETLLDKEAKEPRCLNVMFDLRPLNWREKNTADDKLKCHWQTG